MTPEGLSDLTFPSSQPLFGGRPGPYEFGGALYVVATEVASRFANTNLVVYKSTDGGTTQPWTRVTSLSNTMPNSSASAFYPGSGSVIYIGFMDDASGNHGALHVVTFDMNTETFGSVDDVGITIPNYSGKLFLLRLASGDYCFAWGEFSGGIRNVKFAAKITGTWSSATDVSGATPRSFMFYDMYEDANGDARLLWYETDVSANPTTLHDATISGLVVSNSTIGTVDPAKFINMSQGSPSLYDSATDSVAYPVISKQALDENESLYVLGVDVSTTPVWSTVSVFEESATADDFGFYPQIVRTLTGYAYLWTDLGAGVSLTDAFVLRSTASTLAGPWTAPTTYYDPQTDPTDPPAVSYELFPLYANGLADGSAGVIIGVIQPIDTHNFCGVLYYLPPSITPVTQTLELTKIVDGGPAVPEDFTLTAVGGSPEVEITGPGHVGPEEVSPGTYELSETNESGAQWGDATWGETDWGGGNYTPGAWDCGDAEMPTPTSVVVPEGGTVACTITNTFSGPPPPPQPGSGEENPVGCFELLRLDVTLTPSRHLPTRGSVR